MSETDDTDILLIIPPNFFVANTSGSEESPLESSRTVVHKPSSCTAQVLGKLVNQVHVLESRLSSLEINSTTDTITSFCTVSKTNICDTTDSLDSRSFDSKYFTFPRRKRRKNLRKGRKHNISLSSKDTLKNIPPLELSNDLDVLCIKNPDLNESRSMDGDISSIVSTPSKKNDKLLLNEIDEFLTKVEAYESPDTKYKDDTSGISHENVIQAAGDYISQKYETKSASDEVRLPSGRIVSSSILDKYIYLVRNNAADTKGDKSHASSLQKSINEPSTSFAQPEIKECYESKLETKSPSIRKLNFSDSKDVQPTSTPKRSTQSSINHLDTFRPSSNKIYDRATKVLEQYKAQNHSRPLQGSDFSYLSPKKEEFKMPQMRPFRHDNKENVKLAAMQNKLIDTIDTDLLSLSDLWGDKGDKLDKGESLKLEEERLRREHCEAMIQQLQKKILDQQEKLAVALKVDRAKDAAITKLKEAWLKITGSLDKAEERHRSALEKMIKEVGNFKNVAEEAQKKTNHYETELYKALDLAHDYQDKYKKLLTDKQQAEDSMKKVLEDKTDIISNKDKEIAALKENYETIMKLNKQSTDCVRNLEVALEKEKSEHELTKNNMHELGQRIQSQYEETSLMLQERDLLKSKVNEERARSSILERQLCDRQNEISDLLRKSDALDCEVKSLRKHMDVQKNELKVHYQKQLEDAVLAKLREFQQQLDHAERVIDNEARNKESAIVDNFNKQIFRIQEQHKLEVNVLEEKHREEMKLYRLQLAQASEKIGLLESKVDSYKRRRVQLAGQLHAVMEAQWRQALRLLTNSSRELPPTPVCPTLEQESGSKDHSPEEAPPRDRRELFNFEGLSDNELQQYVKLLLTKPPNLENVTEPEEPTSDRPRLTRRTLNVSKPPWKA